MGIYHWDFPSGNIFTKGISVRPRSGEVLGNFLWMHLGEGKSPMSGMMASKTGKNEVTSENLGLF